MPAFSFRRKIKRSMKESSVMRKLFLLSIMLGSLIAVFTAPANAQSCEITVGRGGASFTFGADGTRNFPDLQGPWDFIRTTKGNCTFQVFNLKNFQGSPKVALYGTDIQKRIRIGATGGQDSGGFRARSLRIIPDPNNAQPCLIELGDNNISQTFHGPIASLAGITGWAFIRRTTGNCVFDVSGQAGTRVSYGSRINRTIRAGATGAQDEGGFRVRSLSIRRAQNVNCSLTLGDNGASQTFFGPARVSDISGWDFVRESTGACEAVVFSGANFSGNQRAFPLPVSGTIRVGFRVRSVVIQPR
jgi:hypothetical protein